MDGPITKIIGFPWCDKHMVKFEALITMQGVFLTARLSLTH